MLRGTEKAFYSEPLGVPDLCEQRGVVTGMQKRRKSRSLSRVG